MTVYLRSWDQRAEKCRGNRPLWRGVAGLLAVSCLMLGGAWAFAQAPDLSKLDIVERSTPDGPVAIVDGVPIDRDTFLRLYHRHLADVMRMTGKKPEDLDNNFRVRAGLDTLGELIRREILVQEAKRRKVSVSQEEVEKKYREKMDEYRQELKKPDGLLPTEEEVLKLAGQTRQEAMESIRRQLIEDQMSDVLLKQRQEKEKVSDKTVREFYEKNREKFKRPGTLHLKHILIRPKPSPDKADEAAWKAAEETAKKAKLRIMAGESFDAVAKQVSETPDAAKGGDLGMVPVAELPPFYVAAAEQLADGDLSDPIRSEFGIHIIQKIGSQPGGDVTFEEAAPRIRAMLEGMQAEDAVNDFIEPIVNNPERTKIFLPLERTLTALGGTPERKGGSATAGATAAGRTANPKSSTPSQASAPATGQKSDQKASGDKASRKKSR